MANIAAAAAADHTLSFIIVPLVNDEPPSRRADALAKLIDLATFIVCNFRT
jgi:hypothetical protein